MPNIRNWEEWDEVEEQLQNEHVRHQVALKNKNKQIIMPTYLTP